MSNETYVTVRGRMTQDADLRFTPSGVGVANFAVAVNSQKFDKNTNEWKDQPAKFWRCAAWNQGKLTRAENVSNLLKKGDAVIATGVLETRNWEDKEGNKRSSIELNVKSIGKDLTFHGQAYAANPPAQQQPAAQSQGGWGGQPSNNGGWGAGPTGEPAF